MNLFAGHRSDGTDIIFSETTHSLFSFASIVDPLAGVNQQIAPGKVGFFMIVDWLQLQALGDIESAGVGAVSVLPIYKIDTFNIYIPGFTAPAAVPTLPPPHVFDSGIIHFKSGLFFPGIPAGGALNIQFNTSLLGTLRSNVGYHYEKTARLV